VCATADSRSHYKNSPRISTVRANRGAEFEVAQADNHGVEMGGTLRSRRAARSISSFDSTQLDTIYSIL
jgi:hypothetical protein